ncbi:Ets DNA-binding protein pokkuri [Orchesella cincta]|uniref:Ets DNA-binding protein pokkuri n=1 Tax=Orchesella cincta TaxID=48709 RepID=A0A1D2MP77_ORCCI|nr:Ets DNA-binding protein pokkuri [Orchesella cincta]
MKNFYGDITPFGTSIISSPLSSHGKRSRRTSTHSSLRPLLFSAAAAAFTRAAAAAAASSLSSPIQQQLPFAYDIKTTIPIRLASDPRLWNRDDVAVFLQWCEREFDLPSFDMDRFQMNVRSIHFDIATKPRLSTGKELLDNHKLSLDIHNCMLSHQNRPDIFAWKEVKNRKKRNVKLLDVCSPLK